MSETEQEEGIEPTEEPAAEEQPTDEEVQARTEAAVQEAGQPIAEESAPGYADEPQKDSADIEGSDEARRVHPDTGGYQYQGDDSAAQVNDQSADE